MAQAARSLGRALAFLGDDEEALPLLAEDAGGDEALDANGAKRDAKYESNPKRSRSAIEDLL